MSECLPPKKKSHPCLMILESGKAHFIFDSYQFSGAIAVAGFFFWGRYIVSHLKGAWCFCSTLFMPMTDPWDERYIYLHEWLFFYGKLISKYISLMDPINKTYLSKWCHDQIAGSLSPPKSSILIGFSWVFHYFHHPFLGWHPYLSSHRSVMGWVELLLSWMIYQT